MVLLLIIGGSLMYMMLVDPHDNVLTEERKLELAAQLQAHRARKRLKREVQRGRQDH